MGQRIRSVLVVDDEPMIRYICGEIFQAMGFIVVEAENAEDALAKIGEGFHFDIVLTDVNMPGRIDGAQLALSLIGRPNIGQVIIMSGDESDQDAAISAPFLLKPFTASALEAIVH